MDRVNRVLPKHVVRAQSSEQKQQALFLLLGEQFTEQHFPKQKVRKEILVSCFSIQNCIYISIDTFFYLGTS